ncbi:LpxI family protein [Desulfohalovibrio reitneri]|uniref:LpxI family protein n=1 Tax=Desulfohalovibrio reitneri TaxID=1307759 RepID=UPI0004A7149D|nr:UDP-2,3-diacylglucosamine diphosphatase LpxI [Desulfohalovibrio reitneri]
MATVGLIAGGGRFPFLVARGVRAAGERVVAVGFPDNTDPALEAEVDAYVRLGMGKLGAVISFFAKQGVDRVVMAGTIAKPRALRDLVPDWRAAKLLPRLRGKGDDALLRAIIGELEKDGFTVSAPHEVVPDLLTPPGVLTRKSPSRETWEDIRYGWPVAKAVGEMDIGQTIVVRRQMVAAVEALEGTDRAVERGCTLAGAGALVLKVCKPGQEVRADLPAAGPDTIKALARGGAACLALEAGKSLFFDRRRALAEAEAAGISVVGVTPDMLAD